jgi:uncharacterized protein
MKKMNFWDWLTLILVVVGGLNWGLVGFFNFNIIDAIFGAMSIASRIIYAIVGLSAIYVAFMPAMMTSEERMGGHMAKGAM